MAFYCQRHSYVQKLTTKVRSCVPTKNSKFVGCFDVILGESPFFPEGGGQPSDIGHINGVDVKWVSRCGSDVVHHTSEPFEIDTEVECSIDWERRFDFMQHHTGQHLLSAVLENDYDLNTVSWELGSTFVNCELNNRSNLTSNVIAEVETKVNLLIREGLKVDVKVVRKDSISSQDLSRLSRGLPDDAPDPLRIVEIDGVNQNMCCGTHLKNVSEIQTFKLLHTEIMRDNVRLYFMCGNRVLRKLAETLSYEKQLTNLLSCSPIDYPSRVQALCKSEKSLAKIGVVHVKRIAVLEASELKKHFKTSKFCFIHREEYDSVYIMAFLKELATFAPPNSTTIIICGPEKGPGVFAVRGSDEFFKAKESKILAVLKARGRARNGVLQGKSECLKEMKSLVKELESFSSM